MSGAIRITDALLGEHGALYAWLDAVEEALREDPSEAELRGLARRAAAVLGSHARVENELLLDEVARRGAEDGPLAVMRREHDDIEALIEEAVALTSGPDVDRAADVDRATDLDRAADADLDRAADVDRAVDLLLEAVAVAREHFEKEELAAFPMAERALDRETLEALGARWAERRRVRTGG